MVSVCSNCNQVLGDKEPLDNTAATHGFCLYCLCIWYVKAGIIGNSLKSAMESAAKIKGCRPVRLISYGGAK